MCKGGGLFRVCCVALDKAQPLTNHHQRTTRYRLQASLLASAVVLCTMLSAPMMLVTAQVEYLMHLQLYVCMPAVDTHCRSILCADGWAQLVRP